MTKQLDKRERAVLFRERLAAGLARKGLSQAALARAVGVDRSTLSQILGSDDARLPNAQVAGGCAAALGVSADWLLGLSDRPEPAADLAAAAMSMTEASRALIDERIFGWHREAAGYKIRHVPATLPDMLKTRDVLAWEYAPTLGRSSEQAIAASEARLSWMRQARSDYEIAVPLHEMRAFAMGEGYYSGLTRDIRAGQIAHWRQLHDQLFPALRLFLFDARRLFSAPITVFGPLQAAVYLGQNYLLFRDTERVQALSRHFDTLVREAEVDARDLPAYLDRIAAEARL